jgi:plastocyanin
MLRFVTPFAARTLSVLLLAALASGGASPPAGADGGAAARLHRVVIEDFAFHPPRLAIRAGDSVEWVNRDLAPHTASAADGGWDSGTLAKQQSYRRGFTAAGSYRYLCAFHPMMRGEIVVAP